MIVQPLHLCLKAMAPAGTAVTSRETEDRRVRFLGLLGGCWHREGLSHNLLLKTSLTRDVISSSPGAIPQRDDFLFVARREWVLLT